MVRKGSSVRVRQRALTDCLYLRGLRSHGLRFAMADGAGRVAPNHAWPIWLDLLRNCGKKPIASRTQLRAERVELCLDCLGGVEVVRRRCFSDLLQQGVLLVEQRDVRTLLS